MHYLPDLCLFFISFDSDYSKINMYIFFKYFFGICFYSIANWKVWGIIRIVKSIQVYVYLITHAILAIIMPAVEHSTMWDTRSNQASKLSGLSTFVNQKTMLLKNVKTKISIILCTGFKNFEISVKAKVCTFEN